MEEHTRELRDYLSVLRKRKKSIFIIVASIFAITVMIAVLLPPTYVSSATILIERQGIPSTMVQSTVTSYAAERIQVIQARVMSRSNLLEIIKQFDLYADKRKLETTVEIIERMREDAKLDVINAKVIDPRTGGPSEATIAFKLSFSGESPHQVQQVANKLTTLYLEGNIESRTKKAEETSLFIREETKRLGRIIQDLEEKQAVFKQEHADTMPNVSKQYYAQKQRIESKILALETRIQTLEERKFLLTGQLAQISPDLQGQDSPSGRLKRLETEYSLARAQYSDDHPDVQRLRRAVDGLKAEVGGNESRDDIAKELVKLRGEIAVLTKKFTADHPDVMRIKQKISVLEENIDSEKVNVEDSYFAEKPDNPAYLTLETQLEGTGSEIRIAKEEKSKQEASLVEIENLLLVAPEVERQYLALIRDYRNAVSEYQKSKSKEARAAIAKTLEAERKGERFSLIDPAALPEEPISPNRPALMFIGLILSFAGGIGFAFVSDALAGTIKGARQVHSMLGVVPLSVLPYRVNLEDLLRRKLSRKRTIIFLIILSISFALLFHFLKTPLDVMWFRAIRKYDTLTN